MAPGCGVLPPETRPCLVGWPLSLRTQRQHDTFDARLRRPDETPVWVTVHLSTRTGAGLGPGIWIQIEDATARQLAVDELIAADQRFNLAMHGAPIGMALVSLEGTFIDVNASFLSDVGIPTCRARHQVLPKRSPIPRTWVRTLRGMRADRRGNR